jgi:hypothetical protein
MIVKFLVSQVCCERSGRLPSVGRRVQRTALLRE